MATRTTSKTAAINQTIAERAYELYMSRGWEDGHDLEDWLTAESQVAAAKPKGKVAAPRKTKRAASA
jgi:hypothetical protein